MKAAPQPHISGAGRKRAATTPMGSGSFVADQFCEQDGAVCAEKKRRVHDGKANWARILSNTPRHGDQQSV
jgi:hypothetical protein